MFLVVSVVIVLMSMSLLLSYITDMIWKQYQNMFMRRETNEIVTRVPALMNGWNPAEHMNDVRVLN